MRARTNFSLMSVAAMLVLSLGCEGASDSEVAEWNTSEVRGRAPQTCEAACQKVVSCLGRGGYGSYGGGGYAECGNGPSSPDYCGYGGYGDGYGGYGNLPGYGQGGYGDGYGSGGYGSGGYGSCWNGYAECGQGPSSPDYCGYGGYGDGYGGYGTLPGYGGTYGSCGGGGGNLLAQCLTGCRALPRPLQRHIINCVMSSHSCKARLACE